MRKDILSHKTDIIEWIAQQKPKAFIAKQLKCKQQTLNTYLKKMDIEYYGNQGSRGRPSSRRKTALEYLSTESPKAYKVRVKLIEDGIKEHKCEECKHTIWNGKPIPLELHHKDGNRDNWEFDNLEILCPNCHAQEPNNSGAALKIVNYCLDCNIEVYKTSKRCRSCGSIHASKLRKK